MFAWRPANHIIFLFVETPRKLITACKSIFIIYALSIFTHLCVQLSASNSNNIRYFNSFGGFWGHPEYKHVL
jgi:hypothetical protein